VGKGAADIKALSEQLEEEEKNTEQAVEAAIQDKLKLEAVINNLEKTKH